MASSSTQPDSHLHNLLSAVTDAILSDSHDLDRIIARYKVPKGEIEALLKVIERLHIAFVSVRPARRFAQQLKVELLDLPQQGMLQRVRFLPPRVQIAAGVALLAGFMLLSRRRLRLPDDAAPEIKVAS
ncbi:MAG: hypothetical protein SGJ24_02860 [Chloroflexota bacterium]|nr:hypothetical protein [Chloroflexota bacterium]